MEWTDTDLALLQSLDAGGTPIDQIARRLGRDEAAVRDHLTIVRARNGPVPFPGEGPRNDEHPASGSDEEGDVPPPTGRPLNDKAAWVSIKGEDGTGD